MACHFSQYNWMQIEVIRIQFQLLQFQQLTDSERLHELLTKAIDKNEKNLIKFRYMK